MTANGRDVVDELLRDNGDLALRVAMFLDHAAPHVGEPRRTELGEQLAALLVEAFLAGKLRGAEELVAMLERGEGGGV